VASVTATGPRDAWATGNVTCPSSGPDGLLITHWNGQSWQGLRPPPGFDTYGGTAIAALSKSYSWTFAVQGFFTSTPQDVALLRHDRRWRQLWLAKGSEINSAVAFSQSDAWAFGSDGLAAYAVRFNGRAWRRVRIPVNPLAAAGPAPGNIWAIGPLAADALRPYSRQTYALARWTTRWRTIPLPAPPHGYYYYGHFGTFVVADGSDGAYVAIDLVTPGPPPAAVPELLHWTGRRWENVTLPIKTYSIGPLAHDGRGGLWIASVPASLNCVNGCYDIEMLHRSAAGTWSTTVVPVDDLGLTAMRLIPGTRSLWGSGSITGTDPNGDFFPVMVKYGP
jgi:hypothetical protein